MFDQMFTGMGLLFTVPALVGSAFFLIRMVMMLIGGTDGGDFAGDDVTAVDIHGADIGDSTHAFAILSFQSISAFMMGFGWAGLVAYLSLEWTVLPSALAGVAGGAAMMWVLGWLLKGMHALATSGNIGIGETVGREGTVYATVPARAVGRGQVSLVIREHSRIYNAITEGESIATGLRIRVQKTNDDNTLTVVAI